MSKKRLLTNYASRTTWHSLPHCTPRSSSQQLSWLQEFGIPVSRRSSHMKHPWAPSTSGIDCGLRDSRERAVIAVEDNGIMRNNGVTFSHLLTFPRCCKFVIPYLRECWPGKSPINAIRGAPQTKKEKETRRKVGPLQLCHAGKNGFIYLISLGPESENWRELYGNDSWKK